MAVARSPRSRNRTSHKSAKDDGGTTLDTTQAAAILKVTERTLEKWRGRGYGPRFSKIGRRVVYRRASIDAFIAEHEGSSTSDFESYSPGAR